MIRLGLFTATALLIALSVPSSAEETLVVAGRRQMVAEPLPIVHTIWGDGVIFPAEFGDTILSQCSRSTLGKGDAYWSPQQTDIDGAEAVFATYRSENRTNEELLANWPDVQLYHRQYIGVIRGPKRNIYISYFPSHGPGASDWRQRPLNLCDGGPSYFGVEVETGAAKVAHIDFDGCMCAVVPAN